MTCLSRDAQRGLTLVELMIAMLLGLIVVGGVLGLFISNSETHRRTGDLARIQENARIGVQFIGRSMREAGGNPCGLPPGMGLIFHLAEAPQNSWWAGGNDFKFSLIGYAGGNGFPANGSVTRVNGSDAIVTVSGSAFAKTVISDAPPGGAMLISSNEGLAADDIMFACSMSRGRGVVFKAGKISVSGTNRSVARTNRFEGAVEDMPVTALGKINAEGWFVGRNTRGGTSLYRAFIGDNGQPEEIAQDVAAMHISYLLPNANGYVAANEVSDDDWLNVIAAYIELTITRNVAANGTAIQRTVGLTVNLRNKFVLGRGNPDGGAPDEGDPDGGNPP
ncbi:MAG: prepilin-type N-terminal cleavage/methylation domain-containing protein [Betaproteobacteria bacterium]|nr:prepilin-type N-terminal cleavage/methylation domain-containing protein [Betaproteobacteria bacterium]